MKDFKKIINNKWFQIIVSATILFFLVWYWPGRDATPEYGVTFSAKYARELELLPQEVLYETIHDLGIKKLRLVAYWDDIQFEKDKFDYRDLDWQMDMAEKFDAEVILAVGKRVPRWPECHLPSWVLQMSESEQEEYLKKFVGDVVSRYKDSPALKLWQVENEPFLVGYATQYCGKDINKNFLESEIALVKEIDPNTPVMLTDSGELGVWLQAYKRGDYFGSTFYVFVANNFFENLRSIMSSNSYIYKREFAELFYGEKPTYLIEVSVEPWLTKPIIRTSFNEQLSKMNVDRAKVIIEKAAKTGFEEQYLWGVEWWYLLKKNGYPELWDYVKGLKEPVI